MNPKDPKVLIFLVPFATIISILSALEQKEPKGFSANGSVVAVKPTANHGNPIVAIKFTNPPYSRQFFPTKEFIEKSKIKPGDHFIKKATSEICTVNGREFQCL